MRRDEKIKIHLWNIRDFTRFNTGDYKYGTIMFIAEHQNHGFSFMQWASYLPIWFWESLEVFQTRRSARVFGWTGKEKNAFEITENIPQEKQQTD